MRSSAAILVVALIIAVAFAAKKKQERQPPANSGIPRSLTEEDAQYVPSLNDDKEFAEMQCSACKASAGLMLERLEKLRKEFHLQPEKIKEYHMVAAIDDMCEHEKNHFGLVQDGAAKVVTTTYKDEYHTDYQGSIVKGAWVTKFFTQTCIEMLERVEDDVVRLWKGASLVVCPMCPKNKEPAAAADESKKEDL